MRKLTLILSLVFTVTLSSPSYAEWTKLGENHIGNTHYVDFERIRKVDGYVYWWELVDLLKPDNDGKLSAKLYNQGDCKLFRFKLLSVLEHKEPMGGGTGETFTPKNPEWNYPPPNSVMETNLKTVCSR